MNIADNNTNIFTMRHADGAPYGLDTITPEVEAPAAELAATNPEFFKDLIAGLDLKWMHGGADNAPAEVVTSDAPLIDNVIEEAGDLVDSALTKLAAGAEKVADISGDVAMVASVTATAAVAMLGAAVVATNEEKQKEDEVAIDGDGDGIAGISADMQDALKCAGNEGVFERLHLAFAGYADVMCAQAGLDQNAIALAGDPALALAEAREAMNAGSGMSRWA